MCFAPKRHAVFRRLNFQQALTDSEAFCKFDFQTCFGPCPRALSERWNFLHFDFEICFAPQRRAFVDLSSPLMAPRTRCFSEPILFDPLEPQKIEKTVGSYLFVHFDPLFSFSVPSLPAQNLSPDSFNLLLQRLQQALHESQWYPIVINTYFMF